MILVAIMTFHWYPTWISLQVTSSKDQDVLPLQDSYDHRPNIKKDTELQNTNYGVFWKASK